MLTSVQFLLYKNPLVHRLSVDICPPRQGIVRVLVYGKASRHQMQPIGDLDR